MDLSARHSSEANVDPAAADSAARALAERELGDRYTQRLRLFASRRINDPTAAEDIAQETLRHVVTALREGKVENLAALPGFVFSTARNLCLHWVRSAARENSAFARLREANGNENAPQADALRSMIDAERRKVVRAALDSLPDADRELLSLLYYKGIQTEDAARDLGITAAAVRVRKHRALQRLARLLGEIPDGNTTDEAGTLD